ncbi:MULTISPECIES: hypothetical protein [Pseudomonas]|uniref:hypothetical protein n=1 Tax=Pseudomonas TaxID=286 RepID=UPI0018D8113F|nr:MULTISPECIES: hypothetical protein [Pseudomonas]MBH3361499.1 hypothetical protein [Pseudomonas sp. URMO17WK12:I11]MDH0620344.1 hypothetical protein [Pseudomonas fulva]
MAYLIAYDNVMSLYEALTRQGRGGLLAHMIISYPEQEELQQWVIMAPADALGPLLYALSSARKGFEAVPDPFSGEAVKYTGTQSQLVQQRDISRLISWTASNTNEFTKHQFVEACIRMNKLGERAEHFGQANCENRMSLDMFMKDPVLRYSRPDGVRAREAYSKTQAFQARAWTASAESLTSTKTRITQQDSQNMSDKIGLLIAFVFS